MLLLNLLFDSGGTTQKQAQLFDAGGFVSGMDWCPMSEEESSSESSGRFLYVDLGAEVNDQYRTAIQAVPRRLNPRSSNSTEPDWRTASRSQRQHPDLVD